MASKKPMSEKAEDAFDKKRGIKEGSKKDFAADKKLGVPIDKDDKKQPKKK